MEINGNQWREIGRLQADMEAVKTDVGEIRGDVGAIKNDIAAIKSGLAVEKAEQRGTMKGYAAAGAVGSAITGAGAWALSKFPWLASLIGSAPR